MYVAHFRSENVENARRDGTSIYNLYRRLIAARRAQPALSVGSYHPTAAEGDLMSIDVSPACSHSARMLSCREAVGLGCSRIRPSARPCVRRIGGNFTK